MAMRPATTTITHFAQVSGHQTRATTKMPADNKKRQKHNFIISFSFS
jgi:hypothetical protein